MFYLPRICEHCLNPSCVASCPSGAMYKREEDGIVLVDQDRCRGWRFCVSGCPYKKVYFNHRTGKAEKCTLCFPRIEAGQPTICSETCVGGCATSGWCSTTPTRCSRRRRPRTSRTCTRRSCRCSSTPRIPQVRPRGAPSRASRTTGSRRPAARRSTPWPPGTGSRCRCTRNTARCRWSGTSRRCRRWRTSCTRRATSEADPDHVFATIDSLRIPLELPGQSVHRGRRRRRAPGAAQARRDPGA